MMRKQAAWMAIMGLVMAVLSAGMARADGLCEFEWKDGQGLPGVDGEVYAMTVWDPDGDGPRPELLIIGGTFSIAGDQVVDNLVAWDGSRWQIIGSGFEEGVYALTVYQGELIVGGEFSTAGGAEANNIAAWDGDRWRALGWGMTGPVYTLAGYHGELIAGGWFTMADDDTVNHIARWNGEFWQPLGVGFSGEDIYSYILSMLVYEDRLIVGGRFTQAGGVSAAHIAQWDGTGWGTFGGGLEGENLVESMLIYNNQLIVGGYIREVGGELAHMIVRWDGEQWQPMGEGMSEGVLFLNLYHGELIAGGNFYSADEIEVNGISRWDGEHWQDMGIRSFNSIHATVIYKDMLIADIYNPDGLRVNKSISGWDGRHWRILFESNGWKYWRVNTSNVYNGQLVVGGENLFWGESFWKEYLGILRNGYWQKYSDEIGTDHICGGAKINSLINYNGRLIAGGWFNIIGGIKANFVAQWDGIAWNPLGVGIGRPDSGPHEVKAMTIYNGKLIVGGQFSQAGGKEAFRIAGWDGSEWSSLGVSESWWREVRQLTVYKGELVALCETYFPELNQICTCIGRWDGKVWRVFGYMLRGNPAAMIIYNNELVLGGYYLLSDNTPVNLIRWDGHTWRSIGGISINDRVSDLTVFNGELIVTGNFTSAGGIEANHIARWDGANWRSMGTGINGQIDKMAVYHGELIAWGGFTQAGGKVSMGWARWGAMEEHVGDLNHDCAVDMGDLSEFATRWGEAGCLYNGWCDESDLNYDGRIDLQDFAVLTSNWLAGM